MYWESLHRKLEAAAETGEADDFIDACLDGPEAIPARDLAEGGGTNGVTEFLLAALALARSESTQRDVAMFLGQHARVGDVSVVDALTKTYGAARRDASRAPGLMSALALYAERDSLARAELSSMLLRVSSADSRYLVVRAAKVIGRFEGRGITTNARHQLEQWAGSDDLAVCSEARQQLAMLALGEAFAQPRTEAVRTALLEAHSAFKSVQVTEEMRHDARLFSGLVDLLLAHLDAPTDSAVYATIVRNRASDLQGLLNDPLETPWPGYASVTERMIEHRIYSIAAGFMRVADGVGSMEEWTNFDAALAELAAVWSLMWEADETVPPALRTAEHAVALPRVGSFLERAVGRRRMKRVLEQFEAAAEPNNTEVRSMRLFYEAVLQSEHVRESEGTAVTIEPGELLRLAVEAPAAAFAVSQFAPGAQAVIKAAGLEEALANAARIAAPVPTDHPACYGNDPSVDNAVRSLLDALRVRLGPAYPREQWRRLEALAVSLVSIARDLRNDLPAFMLSADESGGKGQQASEDDLQEYVFKALRGEYGRYVHWEPTRIAGGRADKGVVFAEAAFPIEVKAEYRDVTREHVRRNFLVQPDRYAGDRDRVSFLLVLDLRKEHADPETALYTLRESFWVDGLTVDPQIAGAAPNAVIVGLFPGNQRKPSSTSVYSRRPRPLRTASGSVIGQDK